MTNADQKAAIRERMAATGENYTTARRAIEQARSHARELAGDAAGVTRRFPATAHRDGRGARGR